MRKNILILLSVVVILLAGCTTNKSSQIKSGKIGLLLTSTINDQGWGTKGYKGLLHIENKHNLDTYYKENVNTEGAVIEAVKDMNRRGVTLLFGHGREFQPYFDQLASKYPNMKFVCINGKVNNKQVTGLIFNNYPVGFFAGMLAAKMTKTNAVAIVAAVKTQQEVEGFVAGVQHVNPAVIPYVTYINDWDNADKALTEIAALKNKQVDVYYPIGDGFTVPALEKIHRDGNYAIGYVSDFSSLGSDTVLTSTVKHVDKLYDMAMTRYLNRTLKGGNLQFDLYHGAITFSQFSTKVPIDVQVWLKRELDDYKKTATLPNGLKVNVAAITKKQKYRN